MKFFSAVAFSSLLLATSALAQKSSVEGYALGADRRPLKNAEVRIQQEKTKNPAVIVRTDAKGRFVATGLPVGSYNVAIVANGVVVASVAHVKTQRDQTARVNLAAKTVSVATAPAQKKPRERYIPPPTGSHMGGFERSSKTKGQGEGYGAQNVGRMSPESINRTQNIPPARPGGP